MLKSWYFICMLQWLKCTSLPCVIFFPFFYYFYIYGDRVQAVAEACELLLQPASAGVKFFADAQSPPRCCRGSLLLACLRATALSHVPCSGGQNQKGLLSGEPLIASLSGCPSVVIISNISHSADTAMGLVPPHWVKTILQCVFHS